MAIFNDDDFNENNSITTIYTKNLMNITATTVTPLVQLNDREEQRKRYIFENQTFYHEPYFSANGFRGLMRRVMTKDMVNFIQEKNKDFKIKAEEFYLYTSGSAADKKSVDNLNWKEIEQIKIHSPILSLFGAGLSSISGKCAITDLKPISSMKIQKILKDESGFETIKYQPLTQTQTFFRNDDINNKSFLTPIIDIEDVTKWKEQYLKSVQKSKELKKNGEIQKETDSNIAQVIKIESILPNVNLSNSINTLYGQTFTDIELGLILKTLIEISKIQIGSHKRLGYGILDWNVELEGQAMFSVICDKDYIFNKTITTSKKCKELISIFDNWALKNYNSENLKL